MEWIFPVLFVVAFLWTKKDLALVCASVSIVSSLVYTIAIPENWTYEEMCLINIGLNLVLAMLSSVHWSNSRKPLARCMIWLSAMAIAVITIDVYMAYEWVRYALLTIQAVALMAIIKLDGRKDYLNDMAANISSFIRAMGAMSSGRKGNKG